MAGTLPGRARNDDGVLDTDSRGNDHPAIAMSSQEEPLPFALTEERPEADDEHAEAANARDIFQGLIVAWRNERAAPEILPYQQHIVDKLKSVLDEEVGGIVPGRRPRSAAQAFLFVVQRGTLTNFVVAWRNLAARSTLRFA